MHFWINKGSQGRGFNGRYVPPSISAGARRNQQQEGPKPMVTPLHRFTIISVAAQRDVRHPTRYPPFSSHHPHLSNHHAVDCETGMCRGVRQGRRLSSLDYLPGAHRQHSAPPIVSGQPTGTPAPRRGIKCGVWTLMGIIPLYIIWDYSNGNRVGVRTMGVVTAVVLFFAVGRLVWFFSKFGTGVRRYEEGHTRATPTSNEQQQMACADNQSHQPSATAAAGTAESAAIGDLQAPATPTSPSEQQPSPPPPYHIALMLPAVQHARDTPPPSYEKAVT